MTTYNTGNALGSSDPRDLYDNAGNLDNFANGPANTYPDRLGMDRTSLAGMRNAFDDFLESSGYTVPVPYAAEIVLTAYNQLIEYDGEFYKLKAGEAPYTTTGAWGTDSTKLVAVGDAALRQELAADDGASKVGFIPSGAGAVPTDVQTKLREFVSVKDFGAVADYDPVTKTGTDNTAAFNAAIDYLKTQTIVDSSIGLREGVGTFSLVIPPGYYKISSSVNMTGIRVARNVQIYGEGAVLFGHGVGYPVIDAIDSRWLSFVGLTVVGDNVNSPRCGIQIGKGAVTTIGNNFFERVNVIGHFTLAPYLNNASETTTHIRCKFVNDYENPGSAFSAVMDGNTFWGVTSLYVSSGLFPSGTIISFTNNTFYSCDFRNGAGGACVWMSSAGNHYYDAGCYFLAFNGPNVVIYCTSTVVSRTLEINGLFESTTTSPVGGYTGVDTVFEFVGNGSNVAFFGFKTQSARPSASNEFMKITNFGSSNRLEGFDIDIAYLSGTGSPVFFTGFTSTTLSGVIKTDDADKLNLGGLSRFVGQIYTSNRSSLPSLPPAGAYQIFDRINSSVFVSDMRASGRAVVGVGNATLAGGTLRLVAGPQVSMWVDEGTNELYFQVVYSGAAGDSGRTIRSGKIALT